MPNGDWVSYLFWRLANSPRYGVVSTGATRTKGFAADLRPEEGGRISRKVQFRLIAFLALGLGMWSFVYQARLSVLPADLDLDAISWPAHLEGVEVCSVEQALFQAEGFPVGAQIRLDSSANAAGNVVEHLTLEAAHSRSYLLVTLISGLFFWSVAAMVFAPRVDQQAVPLFFWISLLYGTGVLVGGVYGQLWPVGHAFVRPLLQLTSLAFLPVAFLHLSLAFPADSPLLIRRPRLPLVLYLIAGALVLWQATNFLGYFRTPGPENWGRLALPQAVADGLLVLQVIAGFTVLVRRATGMGEARQRQQIRWLILGFLVGSAPYVFFRTLPNLFGAPALFPAYFDRILELAVPTGFIFAVVRYRFLNIDIILRRGLIYGFLAAGLVMVVLLPVLLLGPGWNEPWPGWWRLAVIACGLVAGILFRPLHGLIGRGVDRAFFKIERGVDQTLHVLQVDLDAALDHHDFAERFLMATEDTLHLEKCAVVITAGAEVISAGTGDAISAEKWWRDIVDRHASGFSFLAVSEILAETDDPVEGLPPDLTEAGFVAVRTLTAGDRTHGAVFLGPKETGRLFLPGDLDFLSRAADSAGRSLEHQHLARTVAGERLKRRQLDELAHLKDDFLSRVAHDLRTPVTSLGWSVRNLNDGLAGELNNKQKDYLSSIRDAVEHLAGLVTNLLEISRLEKSTVEVVCSSLDPTEAVRRAVGTVKPLAVAGGVELEMAAGACGQAFFNEDKLTEVLVNLLENAVRYSPRGGNVTAMVKDAPPDHLRISVRDEGPGLGGLADPFARFVQGQPSPDGTRGGYGLGLTIAQEYVTLMGGTISGKDHPEGGALFTIHLSRNDKPTGESI